MTGLEPAYPEPYAEKLRCSPLRRFDARRLELHWQGSAEGGQAPAVEGKEVVMEQLCWYPNLTVSIDFKPLQLTLFCPNRNSQQFTRIH